MNSTSEDNISKKYSKKRNNNENNGRKRAKWIRKVFILAFGLSVFFSFTAEILMKKLSIFISFVVLLIIIAIGVLFDIIGIAVTSANEVPFHAMAADKVPGGKEAVKLIKNADIVSNFCNDVVGDICGIISGAAGATIILKILILSNNQNGIMFSILMTGFISTLTIGGKALGKTVAIKSSKTVVNSVAIILSTLKKHFNIEFFSGNGIK